MSEETKKAETTETEQKKSGESQETQEEKKPVIFESQEDYNKSLGRRLEQERAKFADYDTVKSELETLRQKEKEREEQELTEQEKLKNQIVEKENEIKKLQEHKLWRDEYEKNEKAKVDSAIEGFSDEDKELVQALPLDKQMTMVNKLNAKTESKSFNVGGKGERKDDKSFEDKIAGAKTMAEIRRLAREA
jgi:hypothetical protein